MSERKETASTGKPAPIKIVLKGWSDVDTQLMQAALIKAKINKAFAKYNEIEQKARNAFSEATKELKDEYDRIEAAVLMFAELHKGDFEKSKTKKLDNGSVKMSTGRNSVSFISGLKEDEVIDVLSKNKPWYNQLVIEKKQIDKNAVLTAYGTTEDADSILSEFGIEIKKGEDTFKVELKSVA
jgi:phage host-nuclease inhibitor protein Gam